MDVADQVGSISKEMAKDFVEHVLEQQLEDIENCAVYDQCDDFFGFDLDEHELKFLYDVLSNVRTKLVVTWP